MGEGFGVKVRSSGLAVYARGEGMVLGARVEGWLGAKGEELGGCGIKGS